MNKKTYQSPAVKKVRLNISASVLGTCRTSTSGDRLEFSLNCKAPGSLCLT